MHSVISIVDSNEFFSPPTLQQLCVQLCASKAELLLFKSGGGNKLSLKKTVIFPTHIWEVLIDNLEQDTKEYLPIISEIHQKVNLRRIILSNCTNLTDENLRLFMKNQIISGLEIHNCPLLTKQSLIVINEFGRNLECLHLGNSTHILPTDLASWINKPNEEKSKVFKRLTDTVSRFLRLKSAKNENECKEKAGLLKTPKLRKLVIWGHFVHQLQSVREENTGQDNEGAGRDNPSDGRLSIDFWEYLTQEFIHNLEHLDLSGCHEVKNLTFLLKAKESLRFLYLHDVLLDYDELTWGILRNFKELRFLDVSQYNELASVFPKPNVILERIVTSLPNLMGLDISGTNLAGLEWNSSTSRCGIRGLQSREHKWFQFVGLLASHYNASSREGIPAFRVTGSTNMQQLTTALKTYLLRSNMVRKVVRILNAQLQRTNVTEMVPCYTILDLLIQVIQTHIDDKHTLIISLATVFNVLSRIYDSSVEKSLEKCRRDKLFLLTNKVMGIHYQDMSLLRNGILNIHLLTLYMTFPDSHYANTLFPTLLMAGRAVIENNANWSEALSFFLRSTAYLLDLMLDANSVKQVTTVDCISKVCAIVNELFKRNIMNKDTAVFWKIMLKWLGIAADFELCSKFVDSGGIEACLNIIKYGANEDSSNGNPICEVIIPIIVFLMNLLANFSSFERLIVTPALVNQIFYLINNSDNRSYRELQLLRHVSCGFIATAVSKQSSFALQNPSRGELLDGIFKSMKGKEYATSFPLRVRTLDHLYNLLEVQNAPEIHIWALQTILILLKSDAQMVINTIGNDKRIQIDELHAKLVRDKMPGDRSEEVGRLCDRLVQIINNQN